MNRTLLSWLLLVFLACIWGSSFILMKRGMFSESGTPIFTDAQVGALRMSIAGLVMLPFGLPLLTKITSLKLLLSFLVVGFFGNFFPAFLFTFAETKMDSGLAGMLNGFTPFFTILIGLTIFRQPIILRQILGLIVAFGGILLLLGLGGASKSEHEWIHVTAILVATLLYGTSLNTIKTNLSAFSSLQITALAFSLVSVPAFATAFFVDTVDVFKTNSLAMSGLGYISILSLFGTCLALVIFNRIIAMKSAVFASSVTYMIPIVAVTMGVIFNRETVYWTQLLGMVVIIVGVAVANRK